jgi:Co/Zn/Cd efflux system component
MTDLTTSPSGCSCGCATAAQAEARTLRWLLAINAVMFVVEIVAGWLADAVHRADR